MPLISLTQETKTVLSVMNTKIKVRHQGIALEITKEKENRFVIPDYSSGKRVRHVRANLASAKEKAEEICAVLAAGKKDLLDLSPFESEIFAAMNALPCGMRLGRVVDIVRDCCQMVDPDEILPACRFWKDHRPDKKFTPKRPGEATSDYMSRRGRLSDRRRSALESYLKAFTGHFSNKTLDQISTADLKDFFDGKTSWKSAKTRNEVKSAIGLLYDDAAERGYVGKGHNPAREIKPEKINRAAPGVFMPNQVRQILYSLEDTLSLPMALWFFGCLRKENLARLTWADLRAAMQTGFLKISADVDRKTGARAVALEPNLRAWIAWYLARHPDASGAVLPYASNIDNLTRKVVYRSKVLWLINAPRHTCITMRIARGDTVQAIAKAAGNSLSQIQRSYWNKDESITAETAAEYFGILPPAQAENVVQMPTPKAVAEPAARPVAGMIPSS